MSSVERLFASVLAEAEHWNPWWTTPPRRYQIGALAPHERHELVKRCARRAIDLWSEWGEEWRRAATLPRELAFRQFDVLVRIAMREFGSTMGWSPAEIDWWLAWPAYIERSWPLDAYGGIIQVLERSGPLTPMADSWVREMIQLHVICKRGGDPLVRRARELLGKTGEIDVAPGEAWSDAMLSYLRSCDTSRLNAWIELIGVAQECRGGSPTGKWTKAAAGTLSEVGESEFVERTLHWFSLVNEPRTDARERCHAHDPDPNLTILPRHMDILKGMCWLAGTISHPELLRALGKLALSAYRRVPGVGPRAVKVGNAAVYALGQMPGMDAVGQLAMLRVKVRFGTAQKVIEKALASAAEREGMAREEIEELGVPAYGMTEVGRRAEPLGEVTAELAVMGAGAMELRFVRGGKAHKSVPAAVKAAHGEELKELKAAAKDIAAMVSAQRDRLDGLFLENKAWPIAAWRERYLDHPLVGVIARRLIWRVSSGGAARSVAWLEGSGLVDAQGRPVEVVEEGAIVRLWHPIEAGTGETLAWRRFYEEREIRQPFKQAHREVYLLTDAERATGTYSNRFAAHVLKQHQFSALCGVRGWKNKLRLMVDDEYPPATRRLPAWGLRAEFWIEGAGDQYGEDTNEAGVFHHVTTDQVRFYRAESGQARAHAGGGGYGWTGEELAGGLALEEIPALVFSEVMRDVDLFVGVCSVANNPQWQDGGPGGAYRAYWWEHGFGELSQTGSGRRELLERLLPRLKIAPACSLAERFLVVRGKLRTYKIHLGSGNILMEPEDQYLCIVPSSREAGAAGRAGAVFLPFEGDRTLSIILSKAFMLAEDEKITDGTITAQIGRGGAARG